MSDSAPPDSSLVRFDALVDRLPIRLQRGLRWGLSTWPGRIALRSTVAFMRIELFDRSMSIAAQFFTSVFPVLILATSWARDGAGVLSAAVGVPEETQVVMEEALGATSGNATFGVLGALIVLASATSLSRALTRAFAAIWELPRPTFQLGSAWRWVAVVLAFAMALVVARGMGRFFSGLRPPTLWESVGSCTVDVAVAVFVPWVLLVGRVRIGDLLPGALVFAGAMLLVRPASSVWLPHALVVSADRYGSIGIAFTYLAWLYVVSWLLLTASVLGQVIATERRQARQTAADSDERTSGPRRLPRRG